MYMFEFLKKVSTRVNASITEARERVNEKTLPLKKDMETSIENIDERREIKTRELREKYDPFYKIREVKKLVEKVETWKETFAIPQIEENSNTIVEVYSVLKEIMIPLINELKNMTNKALIIARKAKKKAEEIYDIFEKAAIDLNNDIEELEDTILDFKLILEEEFLRIKDAFILFAEDVKSALIHIYDESRDVYHAFGTAAREIRIPLSKVREHIDAAFPVDVTQLIPHFYNSYMAFSYLTYLPTGGQYAVMWELIEHFIHITNEFGDMAEGFKRLGRIFRTVPMQLAKKINISLVTIDKGLYGVTLSFAYLIDHLASNLLGDVLGAEEVVREWQEKKEEFRRMLVENTEGVRKLLDFLTGERIEVLKKIKAQRILINFPSFDFIQFICVDPQGENKTVITEEERRYLILYYKWQDDPESLTPQERRELLELMEKRKETAGRIKARTEEEKRKEEEDYIYLYNKWQSDPESLSPQERARLVEHMERKGQERAEEKLQAEFAETIMQEALQKAAEEAKKQQEQKEIEDRQRRRALLKAQEKQRRAQNKKLAQKMAKKASKKASGKACIIVPLPFIIYTLINYLTIMII